MTAKFRPITSCRTCGASDFEQYLDLGDMPLANSLRLPSDQSPEFRAPLAVLFCRACALSQLSVVVSAPAMFSNYVYRSGISQTFARHCATFAAEARERASLQESSLVVDIGSNDGTLLKAYREIGCRTLGVDPAENISAIAVGSGIETINDFWNLETAGKIAEQWGRPSLITATNVVAHVDDLEAFFKAVQVALADEGLLAIEVPYLADLVEKNQFDTIYHEHLSYFLLRPLLRAAETEGLFPAYVRRIPVHGGGLRVYFAKDARKSDTVTATLAFEEEAGLYDAAVYHRFAREIDSIRKDLRATLTRLVSEGRRIAGYGASAKGATLLNSIGADARLIEYIIDDTPEKQGKLSPGTGIPISDSSRLQASHPAYLLILAWNFVDEIIARTSEFSRRGGRYIIPVPSIRFID